MSLSAWFAVVLFGILAHLVGRRAQKYGRRYWPWAIVSFITGPFGLLVVFLILESRHHKELEEQEPEEALKSDQTASEN